MPQTFVAATSNLAPSSMLPVLWCNTSFEIGCKQCSIPTSKHTFISWAVIFRSLLCRTNIKPLWGKLSALSTVKCWPQLHVHKEGRLGGFQPYRKQRASLKASLWRTKPCSTIGTDNQLEAPFTDDASITLFCCYKSV